MVVSPFSWPGRRRADRSLCRESFLADGGGNIASGLLDENVNGTLALALPFLPSGTQAGTYTLASNGRGTATFTTSGRKYTLVFYVGAVGTNTTAVFQETDSAIASDGLLALQQSGPFTQASIEGNYAMDASGVSGAASQVTSERLPVRVQWH